MRAVFEKMTNNTLRSRIAERIEQAILDGSLQPGERLVERKLAAQFATSLTAVREALIELEGNGLVAKKPNSATYVTKMNLEAAEKIFAVRRILEGFAFEEAARLATAEQIKHLEELYLKLLDAARTQDCRAFIQVDYDLHEMIWQISGNAYLEAALRRVVLPLFAFTAIRIVVGSPLDLLQDAQSHLPLLEAIKSKDPKAARNVFMVALQEWLSKTQAWMFGESRKASNDCLLDAGDRRAILSRFQ